MKLLGRSITTKLFLVNALILAVFGIIIFIVHTSFKNIEYSLKKTIDEDVRQVTTNAQLGRELTRIFADANLLVSAIYEDAKRLNQEGARILDTTANLITQSTDRDLQQSLSDFNLKFRDILLQGYTINQIVRELQTLDRNLSQALVVLDETIDQKMLTLMMEGGLSSSLESVKNLIPVYRETVLRIAVELTSVQRTHAEMRQAEELHPVIFSLLDDLAMRFQTLKTVDPDIAQNGDILIATVQTYKAKIITFHQALTLFRNHLDELNILQNQVLTNMKTLDEGIAATTDKLKQNVAETINTARQGILLLSAVFIGILGLAILGTRWITNPLTSLSHCAEQLADGDIRANVLEIKTHDEIGTLSLAFRKLITYFREMAQAVTEISQGNLELPIGIRSRHDILGNGFQQMIVYLKEMGEFAAHVARGDLRGQITLRSRTDQLGNAVARMKEGLIALIAEIRSGADNIASISTQVLSTSNQNAKALEKIGNAAEVTSSAMQQMSSSAEEVRLNIEHLTSSVEETSASISQMITSITHVAENSRKLASFADSTRTTMATSVQSLETVAAQAEHSKRLAETTTQDAASGQESVAQMITRVAGISEITRQISSIVARLEDRSKEIGTILDVINEVADQTSLLALNASIIAAQAGEHGRGFAVVADEIKDLATRVGTSTQEIAKIVKSVQHESSDAVKALEQGQREVQDGVAIAHKAGEALQKIAQSAENSSHVAAGIAVLVTNQSTASTQVAESIRDVTNMINEISQATQEQEKNSSQLFEVVEQMQLLAAQVLRAMQEQQKSTLHVTDFMEGVISSVEENTPTVTQLAGLANELADQADVLKQHVARFTLPDSDTRSLGSTADERR